MKSTLPEFSLQPGIIDKNWRRQWRDMEATVLTSSLIMCTGALHTLNVIT